MARVVVIGAGQGGLSAAIHARLRGHDVLVLDPNGSGGKARRIHQDGFTLDPGPSIIIMPWVYQDVFRAAGRNPEDYLRFQRLDPISRVLFEGQEPLDLPADPEACREVVDRLDPEDGRNFRNLMRILAEVAPAIRESIFKHPYDKPWQLLDPKLVRIGMRFDVRKSYKELVDGWFRSPLLRAFFYGFPSYGGQTYHSKAAGALMIPYLMVDEGVWYPEGGVASIPESFRRLAEELGVEFREFRATGIRTQGNKAIAVQTAEGEVPCDHLISNVDPLTVGGWLGRVHTEEPSLSYFTLHWGIRAPTDGLEHHTLLIPERFEAGLQGLYDRESFPDPPIVYLNATNRVDPATAPLGSTNLFAVVTVPADTPRMDWERRTSEYREIVLRQLSAFGLRPREDDVAFERLQNPPLFAERDGSYRGSLYGAHERHRLFGLFPHPNRDPQVRNLLYCGGGVQPGAGLPMVTLSGKFAASMLP